MTESNEKERIRLLSGLALQRGNSFAWQLRLLQRAFSDLGYESEVSGPPFNEVSLPAKRGAPGGAHDRAWVLLGYPDQFRFIEAAAGAVATAEPTPAGMTTAVTGGATVIPTFLWTQLSGPPRSSELGFYRLVRPVALTERSWSFLAAGVRSFFAGGIPIIPHGVDTATFTPPSGDDARRSRVVELRRALGVEDDFVIGTVAANSFRKRYDRMFEAFAILRKRLHGARRRPRFVVKTNRVRAIDGRDLSELAERLGIGSDVRFIERNLSEQELVTLFCSLDLYLNLSEWEGFCIPVIEAMACGVPVVSHDVQGPGEILPYSDLIVPGSTRSTEEGVLLLDASPEQAAKVLERAYREEHLRRVSSDIGRKTAVDLYDIHHVAQDWLDLFAELSSPALVHRK